MASIAREYSRAVRNETQFWGTFPLDIPIAVGDIIQLEGDGRMIKVKSALDWPGWRDALPVDTKDVSGQNQWSWHATISKSGSAEGGVKSATGAEVSASVKVSFSAVGAFILAYTSCKHHIFRDADKAKRMVLSAANMGDWADRYALITEVIEADPATVLVSSEKKSTFALSAKAALPADLGALNFADPKFSVGGITTEGAVHQSMNTKAFPLYHCVRIRRDWLRRVRAELSFTQNPDPSEIFDDSPFDDDQ